MFSQSKIGFASLTSYPKEELFRLVVDGDLLQREGGWLAYENREPGCLQAFFEALLFISQDDSRPLTLEYLQTIHCLVDRVDTGFRVGEEGVYRRRMRMAPPGFFRTNSFLQVGVSYPVNTSNTSMAGILEFLNRLESSDEYEKYQLIIKMYSEESASYIEITKQTLAKVKNELGVSSNQELAQRVYTLLEKNDAQFGNYLEDQQICEFLQKFIDQYYADLAKANTDDEKLRAVVAFVQKAEQLHPFFDKNIRTFALLMFMRLVMQLRNEFVVPTFVNPNQFDLHSVDELLVKAKQAMQRTKEVMQGKSLDGYDAGAQTKEVKEQFQAISKVFAGGISPEKLTEFNDIFDSFKLKSLKRKISALFFSVFESGAMSTVIETRYPDSNCDFEKMSEDGDVLAAQIVFLLKATKRWHALEKTEDCEQAMKEIEEAKMRLPVMWGNDGDIKVSLDFHSLLDRSKQILEEILTALKEKAPTTQMSETKFEEERPRLAF